MSEEQGLDYKMVPAQKKRIYMRNREVVEFEKELETSRLAAENAENQPSGKPVESENPTSTGDQKTVDWQKRYSDLQSHATKKENEAKKQADDLAQKLTELEKQLKETQKAKTVYPTSEAELEEWAKQFPPLYNIMTTIALKAKGSEAEELREKVKELEEFKAAYANEKGRTDLLKIHPDANEIEKDPRFAEWYSEQEPEIKSLVDSGNPNKIGKAITIFKKDYGIVTKTAQEVKKEASKAINVGPTPRDVPKDEQVWYESQVAKMTAKQYARLEPEIEKARAEGRYVMDISRRAS